MTPSITSWARLEPRTRSADMAAGLTARIADPLWLLARQWQVGEFLGEDVGSPVSARLRTEVAPFTAYRAGHGTVVPYDGLVPLEATVERESAADALDPRHAAEAGQQFLRLLAAQQLDGVAAAFTKAMPFTAPATGASDVANDRRLLMFVDRVPDGGQLAAAFGPSPVTDLPPDPPIPAAQRDAVLMVADRWVSWYAESITLASPESSAWLDNRMEYSFALSAHDSTGEIVLTADEYDGGRLDWLDLDVARDESLGTGPTSETRVDTLMPTAATYAGMPATRWWECEDARINFGALDAEPTDLIRMMLVEFATTYGNDNFIIPIELPVGTLSRIVSLVVSDTFGEQMLIPPAAGAGWSLFTQSVSGSTESLPVLALMPTVTDSVDGPALEEVLLLRDEMANMAWGIETHVTGPAGLAVDRHSVLAQEAAAPIAEPDPPELQYRLAGDVPENWLPLIPDRVDGEVRLVRALQQRVKDGQVVGVPPAGRLLAPEGLWLYPEEVPAAGARVTRGWQVARSSDGVTHLWLGRAKSAGRGPGSSGLRFDTVDP